MRRDILDAGQRIEYYKIFEIINDCLGTNYTGWMKGTWPNNWGNGKFRMWFPKLAETKNGQLVSAAFQCINTISDDWSEVIFDDLKNTQFDMTKKYHGYDLVFAKEPNGGPYIFRGVYIRDEEKSAPNHDVSRRIATKARIIGETDFDIELLDSVVSAPQDINTPMAPKCVEVHENGVTSVICGNCSESFLKASRCPNCGQLIKYQ